MTRCGLRRPFGAARNSSRTVPWLTISTDAHHPKHLGNMRYGVVTARRGWLAAGDIMNTLNAAGFAQAIQAKT